MRSNRPAPGKLRARLCLEHLEARQVLSGTQPTAVEQLLLEQLNDIRANPAAYGASIGLDLSNVAPSQPLAFDGNLITAARQHSLDMNNRNYFAHNTPEGLDPGQQMSANGFSWSAWGQSIAAGSAYPMPADALRALIIDNGVPDLGHRMHLLDMQPVFYTQNLAGVGIVQNASGQYSNYYTIDTAAATSVRPYITGVVISDLNGNGKYNIGEGLAGVTITVSGVGSVQTFDSGGYSIPVNPGTYTVTASGGSLAAPIVRTVTVGTTNARLTLAAGQGDYIQKIYQRVLGRPAKAGEVNFWLQVLQGPAGLGGVVTGIELSAEARTRLVTSWYGTFLGRSPNNGEEQFWVGAMLQGASEEDVLNGIFASNEYYNRAQSLNGGATGDARYVQTLYVTILGRAASSGEVNGWAATLQQVGRGAVVGAFLHSVEYRSNVVRYDYLSILHRTTQPSNAEVAGWVNTGLNQCNLRMRFEASAEFLLNG